MAERLRQPGECWQAPLNERWWVFMKLETRKRRLPFNVPALRGSPH